ncbi:hypothetical protein [Amycolatopsis cihanbeyliensis]|uniref:Type VII secretion system (Wss) protein ESAT-6 n=1 Tax=Amycolatopsis cihanbeyliensis TaxID=1128664 RepID=A0A542DEU1_AMYCI|nr:hypothetical protein [Amycolatopsis cihanbeyliensis]TQJ01593.1 hypothetical protein FB471_1286 [Amycolatopsis cihanbeyliensis]
MGQALNTQVNGSSGTCVEAADWLAKLYSQAHQAAAAATGARGTAEADWHGPAQEAFHEATTNVDTHTRAIADRAFECEWALRDFADSLDSINAKMDDALAKATAAGLRVEGPFIIAPEAPAAPKLLPTGPCGTADATAIMQQNQEAIAAYNVKAAAYNECKAIVNQARNLEQTAHETLRATMGKATETANDTVSSLFTWVSQTRSYVGGGENSRRLAAAKAERLFAQSKFLNDFALGAVSDTNPAQQRILNRAAELANDGGKQQTRAQQFEKWVKMIPKDVRDVVTRYPGQGAVERLSDHSNVKVPDFSSRMLRSVPYVGAGLTVVNESIGAAKGEQSWGRAAADTAAAIGGGALGGALTGAVAGSAFGPFGTIVLGLAGGFGGAMFAQDIVAGFAGDGK